MQKTILFILLSLPGVLSCTAQNIKSLQLTDTKAEYEPVNFRLSGVKDDRADKSTIGHIKEGTIDLEGGLEHSLEQYIATNMAQDNNNMPVTMHITQFEITEKPAGGNRQFELKIGIAYYAGTARLIAYNGSSFAQSHGEADAYIDKLIRQNLSGNLKEFDQWVGKNKDAISAEPTIEVQVNFAHSTDKKDYILYNKNQKLYISNFEGRPDDNINGAAATLSGIGMNYQSSSLNNKTKVSVTLSIYFDKSRSWMKPNGKNVTTLMHEQRHFEITAIKACELKELIEQTHFTPEHYKTQLKDLLNQIQAEGAAMQNVYDSETEHGTLIDEQEAWAKNVDSMLGAQKCY